MIVDCSDCTVRNIACADCVVTVLLGMPGGEESAPVRVGPRSSKIDIDQEELGAIDVLAEGGLVPRLRLVVASEDAGEVQSLPSRDTGADQRAV